MIGPVTTIIATVAEHYGLSVDDIKGPRHFRKVARPRQMVMLLARELTIKSYTEIGMTLRRDHTTVIHGERNMRALIQTDKVLAGHYAVLRAQCSNALSGFSRRAA